MMRLKTEITKSDKTRRHEKGKPATKSRSSLRINVWDAKFWSVLRQTLQDGHYNTRTQNTYMHWIKRFVFFHQNQQPEKFDCRHLRSFLEHLTGEMEVTPVSHNQAAAALAFFYNQILGLDCRPPQNSPRGNKDGMLSRTGQEQ